MNIFQQIWNWIIGLFKKPITVVQPVTQPVSPTQPAPVTQPVAPAAPAPDTPITPVAPVSKSFGDSFGSSFSS